MFLHIEKKLNNPPQGLLTNIVTGYLIGVVPGQILVIAGLSSSMVSSAGHKDVHRSPP